MRRLRRLGGLALLALLAGCAPAVRLKGDAAMYRAQQQREHALAGTDHWSLSGRLGVSDGRNGGSGSLEWHQDGDRYDFQLRAPITGRSFRLTGGPGGAMLDGLDGGPLRGADAESLMRRALGWEVPLSDLRAWVLGLRADSGPAELRFGEDKLPSLLLQDGWTVDYRRWDVSRTPAMPVQIFATKPPYAVRLFIESWQLK